MMALLSTHKEILSFCLSGLGILLSLAFGGILSWKHRICLDYESRRDVAISILRDRFVQRTSKHYSEIANEMENGQVAVEEIYRRPEEQQLISELSTTLEDKNRVSRYHRWLVIASQAAFGCIWFAIFVIGAAIALLWVTPALSVWICWGVLLSSLVIGFFAAVTAMFLLDGRFFRLVHRIIEPEGE